MMLVLSRSFNEIIMIGDNIKLTVVDIRGPNVRIGIEAPGDISIHRGEVYEAIHRDGAKTPSYGKDNAQNMVDEMRKNLGRKLGDSRTIQRTKRKNEKR